MNIDAAPGMNTVSRHDIQNLANEVSAECRLLAGSSHPASDVEWGNIKKRVNKCVAIRF
jgi:hypothetical protein